MNIPPGIIKPLYVLILSSLKWWDDESKEIRKKRKVRVKQRGDRGEGVREVVECGVSQGGGQGANGKTNTALREHSLKHQ